MRKKHKSLRYVPVIILMTVAFFLISYPFVSNWMFENSADSVVTALEEQAEATDDKENDAELEAAHKYNETLASVRVNLTDPFDESIMGEENAEYASLLCMTDDGIMGFISIPSIDVDLPIYHGTSSEVLEQGIGHLEGTSLPVGGNNTHCVLTGHTGLSNAKLFTDLIELEEGDIFFLNVMDEKLAYEVDQILVVEPDELDALYIVDGKDYCTLVTCTPYGINSHRLLVRGERTDYEEAASDENTYKPKEVQSSWMQEYKESLLISLAALGVCLILFFVIKRIKSRKPNKEK